MATVPMSERGFFYYRVPQTGGRGGGVNPAESIDQAKTTLEDRNTEAFFRDNILTTNDKLVLEVVPAGKNGLISYTVAPWGYGRKDLVMWAFGEQSLEPIDEEGQLKTETIYDLPEDVQVAYWQQMLAMLDSLERHFPLDKFAAYQNDSPYIRGQDGKNPARTMPKPHAHLASVDPGPFEHDDKDWTFPHLLEEEDFLAKHFPTLYRAAENALQPLLNAQFIKITADEDQPVYRYHLPFGREEAHNPERAKQIQQLMAVNAMMYHELTKSWFNGISAEDAAKRIPDTMRVKLYLDDEGDEKNGNYVIAVSPAPLSGAGPIEVFERVDLIRDKGLNPIWTDNSIKPVFRPVVMHAQEDIRRGEQKEWPQRADILEFPLIERPAPEEHEIYLRAA